MDPNAYNTKRNFVKNELGRCVSAMLPEVVRLEYRVQSFLPQEIVAIRFSSGGPITADVTGMTLFETAAAVLQALNLGEPIF